MPTSPRILGLFALALAIQLFVPPSARAQYRLAPGDIVIADHGVELGHKTIVLRKADGSVIEPASGFDFDNSDIPLSGVVDVAIDSRGRILALVFDPTSQSPAVFRIDPSGSFIPVVGPMTNDAFGMEVDKFGNIVIANGFVGLVRVTPDGLARNLTPGRHASGVAIGSNGDYFVTSAVSSEIRRVTPAGVVSTFFSGAVLLNAIGIERDHADHLFVANAGRRDILELTPDARLSVFSRDNAFTFPTSIGLKGRDELVVADGGTSGQGLDAVFEVAPNGAARPLLFDAQDGVINGLPIDDPFGVAVVPNLFVTYSGQAARGGAISVILQGDPGAPFLLGVSAGSDRTPLSAIFRNEDRFLDLSLGQLVGQITGTLDGGGRVFTLQIPLGMPTRRYFIQAVTLDPVTGRVDDISNVISAEVF